MIPQKEAVRDLDQVPQHQKIEDNEDPSSQLLSQPSPLPKAKRAKKGKEIGLSVEAEEATPEVEDSRLLAGVREGPATVEDTVDMGVDPDLSLGLDRLAYGAPKQTQIRNKNGQFQRKPNMPNGGESSEIEGKTKKAKRPRKSKADEEIALESQRTQATDYSIPENPLPILPKSTKAKRKAKTPIVKPRSSATVNDESAKDATTEQDASQPELDSQEYLVQASNQLRSDVVSAAPEQIEDETSTPPRPSKKALGKRKAVEPIRNSARKAKRRKENGPAGRDLRQIGFSKPPSEHESQPDVSTLR